MKVKVIKEKCIHCGICATIAPSVFVIPDDDTALVKAQPTQENETQAKEAADTCPTEAIEVL